jgi:DNA polymerase III subunit alpha
VSESPYAHLHVHTEYSMLDGAARLKELFKEVKSHGMTHVAMTDHGNMFGAAEFFKQAKDNGITPVIGIEPYIAPESRRNTNRILWGQPHQKRDDVSASGSYLHKTLWARNREGLHNLFKLTSRSYAEGWMGKYARMDKEIIAEHAAAPRPGGRGAQVGRRVPGHLRQGELLPRADGPRPRHRDQGP